jgi:hypothetical protein
VPQAQDAEAARADGRRLESGVCLRPVGAETRSGSAVRRGCGGHGLFISGLRPQPVLLEVAVGCIGRLRLVCRLFELVLLARGDRSKELEILVLRHELSILWRQARRPWLAPRDWLFLAALNRVLPRRSWCVFSVTPDTLLRWHRVVARHWTFSHRRPARPPVDRRVRELIVRLGRKNSTWGLRPDRQGAAQARDRRLGNAGAERSQGSRCSASGAAPPAELACVSPTNAATTTLACDFFTVDTARVQRLYVLAFICVGRPSTPSSTAKRSQSSGRPFRRRTRTPTSSAGSAAHDGVPRPAPDPESPPAQACPPCLCPTLQRAQAAPGARSACARPDRGARRRLGMGDRRAPA